MKKFFSILKSLGITAGMNLLLLGILLLFSRMVHREIGQALLFLSVTLLLTLGVCLFATIPAVGRGILWGCMGISLGLHLILSIVVGFTGGTALTEHWPGRNNMAGLLFMVISLSVWFISVFVITVSRSRRRGRALRAEKRNVKYASKGYTKEWQTLSPARSRFLAILRGFLAVLWSYTLTGVIFELCRDFNWADTMLGYVAFPLLWCLMAASYGKHDREHRVAYALSANVTNLLLFLLSTWLLTLANTPSIRYRFVLQLDSVLTSPFENPEQLLAIGIFLTGLIAAVVFGVGHRTKKS